MQGKLPSFPSNEELIQTISFFFFNLQKRGCRHFIITTAVTVKGHRLDNLTLFVQSLLILSNLGHTCCTVLTRRASTVTLGVGFNFREVTDFSALQASFVQPWDTVSYPMAKESCSGENLSPGVTENGKKVFVCWHWGKRIYEQTTQDKKLWKTLVIFLEGRHYLQ